LPYLVAGLFNEPHPFSIMNDRSAVETLFLAIGLTVVLIGGLLIAVKLAQLLIGRISRKEEEA
jgi:hypothetical protein